MNEKTAIISPSAANVFSGANGAFLDVNGNLNTFAMRPFIDEKTGQSCITRFIGGDPKDPKCYQSVPIQRNATLRRDEWKQLDDVLVEVKSTTLDGVNDLETEGLVFDLGGNGMATTVLEHHTMDQPFTATLSMDGVVRGDNDRIDYGVEYLPLPINHVDFLLTAREVAVSRKMGNPLNVDQARAAARAVMLKREQMLFTNVTYKFGGGLIYSYLNHPNRNTVSMGTNWKSDTLANIYADIKLMLQALIDKNQPGPFGLYYPRDCATKFDDDYATTTAQNLTLRERVMKLEGIKFCKKNDTLPTGNAVMVNLQKDTVRLVRGMGLTNLEWSADPMVFNYKTMAIEIPQVRADAANQCGVCHCS
jgi:hypothetical protein